MHMRTKWECQNSMWAEIKEDEKVIWSGLTEGREHGLATSIVLKLTEYLQGQHHWCFVDTSLPLLLILLTLCSSLSPSSHTRTHKSTQYLCVEDFYHRICHYRYSFVSSREFLSWKIGVPSLFATLDNMLKVRTSSFAIFGYVHPRGIIIVHCLYYVMSTIRTHARLCVRRKAKAKYLEFWSRQRNGPCLGKKC